MRHNCSPFEIVHCDGVYVLRLHSRSSTKRLRALCMANETWTLIIPPHYMVDHAGCCCQLQPTKSRKCSSSPCGWWEFFVTNGQKVLNFSFDFMHLLYQRQNLWMRLKRRDFYWPRSVYSPNNLMDLQKLSGTIGEKYTSICMELHDMQRMFLRA